MKFKTGLQLSVVFPVAFAIAAILILRWQHGMEPNSGGGNSAMMAMIGLIGVIMAAVIVAYSRDIIERISALNKWAQEVLEGHLDARPAVVSADDEVGRLSSALGRMLAELRDAYSSAQLEADKHRKGETASLAATKHLSEALVRMKTTQQDLVRQERTSVLNRVIGGIAHDFNDAMTPILGITEMILAQPSALDEKSVALEHIRNVHDAAEQIRRSLRNLAGGSPAVQASGGPTDVARVIRSAIKLTEERWKDAAGESEPALVLREELALTPPVAANELDLRDAVVQLILNAVEAMPNGGVLTLSCRHAAGFVIIDVKDTGAGMDREVCARCREPFFSTKNTMGAGMGLTIVESTVRRHGGRLSIESEVGNGTQATVTLPVWKVVKPASESAPMASVNLRKLNIMAVDDDRWTREVLNKALSLDGHSVETAESAAECLEKMRTKDFDVAIVDRVMPVTGGDQLAKAIKANWPGMPVLMLTGFSDVMVDGKLVPTGVDMVLPKPVTVAELRQGLAAVLDRSKSGEARQENA